MKFQEHSNKRNIGVIKCGNNMKILIVDTTYFGININREKTCEHIHSWALQKDVQIEILTSPQGIAFYKSVFNNETFQNISCLEIPFSRKGIDPNLLTVSKEFLLRAVGILFVKNKNWSLVYGITSIWSDVFAIKILTRKSSNLKSFITFDNFVPKPKERPGAFLKNSLAYCAHLVTLRMLRSSDVIFAYLTEVNFKRLLKLGFDPAKVIRFDNGLSLDYINSISVETRTYDLAYLGRIHVAKGIFDFIEVVFRVKQTNQNVRAIVIGSGDESTTHAVMKKIKDLQLESQIDLKGFVSLKEKYKLLKSSQLFLFMSYDESYPLSVLEAACCHLPIVAYNLDIYHSNPYRLLNMQLADIGNIDDVVGKVNKLLQSISKFKPHECLSEVIPNYKSNSLMELEVFRKHII